MMTQFSEYSFIGQARKDTAHDADKDSIFLNQGHNFSDAVLRTKTIVIFRT